MRDGEFQLFVKNPETGTREMRYRFTFDGPDGEPLTFVGVKWMKPKGRVNTWSPSTTLYSRIERADGTTAWCGILKIGLSRDAEAVPVDPAGRRVRPRRRPARGVGLQPLLRARAARASARGLSCRDAVAKEEEALLLQHRVKLEVERRRRSAAPSRIPISPPPPTSLGAIVRNSSSSAPAATSAASSVGPPSTSSERTPWRSARRVHPGDEIELGSGNPLHGQRRPARPAASRSELVSTTMRESGILKERRVHGQLHRARGRDRERHRLAAPARAAARAARRFARSGRSVRCRSSPVPAMTASTWVRSVRNSSRSASLEISSVRPASVARPSARRDHVRDHVGAVRRSELGEAEVGVGAAPTSTAPRSGKELAPSCVSDGAGQRQREPPCVVRVPRRAARGRLPRTRASVRRA